MISVYLIVDIDIGIGVGGSAVASIVYNSYRTIFATFGAAAQNAISIGSAFRRRPIQLDSRGCL